MLLPFVLLDFIERIIDIGQERPKHIIITISKISANGIITHPKRRLFMSEIETGKYRHFKGNEYEVLYIEVQRNA